MLEKRCESKWRKNEKEMFLSCQPATCTSGIIQRKTREEESIPRVTITALFLQVQVCQLNKKKIFPVNPMNLRHDKRPRGEDSKNVVSLATAAIMVLLLLHSWTHQMKMNTGNFKEKGQVTREKRAKHHWTASHRYMTAI